MIFSYFKHYFIVFNVNVHLAVPFVELSRGGSQLGRFCLQHYLSEHSYSHTSLIFLIAWNTSCYLHFAFCFHRVQGVISLLMTKPPENQPPLLPHGRQDCSPPWPMTNPSKSHHQNFTLLPHFLKYYRRYCLNVLKTSIKLQSQMYVARWITRHYV